MVLLVTFLGEAVHGFAPLSAKQGQRNHGANPLAFFDGPKKRSTVFTFAAAVPPPEPMIKAVAVKLYTGDQRSGSNLGMDRPRIMCHAVGGSDRCFVFVVLGACMNECI